MPLFPLLLSLIPLTLTFKIQYEQVSQMTLARGSPFVGPFKQYKNNDLTHLPLDSFYDALRQFDFMLLYFETESNP